MTNQPEKILISGGTGLIGRYLAEKLSGEGHTVSLLSTRHSPSHKFPVYHWDIERGYADIAAVTSASCIIHLAGANLADKPWTQKRNTKSDLSDANCRGMKMFQGSLRKSKLVRTDLRNANLYGVEFFRTGVGETKFDGANLKMTKLHKRTDLLPERKAKKTILDE